MSQRTERVDELLRQEIGALLAKEVADPRLGFATITEVETSPDLRHAKVWVSVIGQKGDRDDGGAEGLHGGCLLLLMGTGGSNCGTSRQSARRIWSAQACA